MLNEPKVTFFQLIANVVESGAGYTDHTAYVLAGVAQDLLDVVKLSRTACDVGQMRVKIKARIDYRLERQGERVAEIVEQRRSSQKTVDADVRSKDADTEIRLGEAEDRRKAAALERFKVTLSIVQQYGGGVTFNVKELEKLAEKVDRGEALGITLQQAFEKQMSETSTPIKKLEDPGSFDT